MVFKTRKCVDHKGFQHTFFSLDNGETWVESKPWKDIQSYITDAYVESLPRDIPSVSRDYSVSPYDASKNRLRKKGYRV